MYVLVGETMCIPDFHGTHCHWESGTPVLTSYFAHRTLLGLYIDASTNFQLTSSLLGTYLPANKASPSFVVQVYLPFRSWQHLE